MNYYVQPGSDGGNQGSPEFTSLKPKKSFKETMGGISFVLFFLTLLIIGYGVFLNYSVTRVQGETALLQEQIVQKKLEFRELEKSRVSNIIIAQNAVKKIDAIDVRWSEVLTLLLDATPDDIVYRSYTGNENGAITTSVMAPSFRRVADLIDILQSKSFVESAFVPSVVKGTSPTNAATYSFSLNVKYNEK